MTDVRIYYFLSGLANKLNKTVILFDVTCAFLGEKCIWHNEMLKFTFKVHSRVLQLLFQQGVHQFPQVFEDHTDPNGSL